MFFSLNKRQLKRQLSCWLVCLTLLLAALAPAISHAVEAARSGSGWVEVCTTSGVQYVRVDGADTQQPAPDKSAMHARLHCPFCSIHITGLELPPASPVFALLLLPPGSAPELRFDAPPKLAVWRAFRPRGPPDFS